MKKSKIIYLRWFIHHHSMTITFFIDKGLKTLIERFEGHVTIPKIMESFPAIWNHSDYDPTFDGIIDFRSCKMELKIAELNQLIASLSTAENALKAKAAILVSEPMAAAMGAIYADQMKSHHMSGVFCSNSEVERFLAVDPIIFKRLEQAGAEQIEI